MPLAAGPLRVFEYWQWSALVVGLRLARTVDGDA